MRLFHTIVLLVLIASCGTSSMSEQRTPDPAPTTSTCIDGFRISGYRNDLDRGRGLLELSGVSYQEAIAQQATSEGEEGDVLFEAGLFMYGMLDDPDSSAGGARYQEAQNLRCVVDYVLAADTDNELEARLPALQEARALYEASRVTQ